MLIICQIHYSELASCLTPPLGFSHGWFVGKDEGNTASTKKYQVEMFDNSGC